MLVFRKGLVDCVKIIWASPAFLEYYSCAIVKLYVDGWVQFSVYVDPELGRHCGKGDYVCKGLIIKEEYKRKFSGLRCGHILGVRHLCKP